MLATILLSAAAAVPATAALEGERGRVELSLASGLPVTWQSCAAACGDGGTFPLMRDGAGGTRMRFLVPNDSAATVAVNAIGYAASWSQRADRAELTLTSLRPVGGRTLTQRYALDPRGRLLEAVLEPPPGARLAIAGGTDLVPARLPGLGGIYSDARAVAVVDGEQERLAEEGEPAVTGRALAAGDWAGVRGRFWALLAQGADPLVLDAAESARDVPVLVLGGADAGAAALRLTFYGGPVAKPELAAAAPPLTGLLYAVLWEPLRQLSFGLQWLLDRWQDLVGHAWLAILLLSLSVKLLMTPLIVVAERWQADVNRIRSRLEPELAAIRRECRGEEAHNRTLAVYRKHGVSHFYTFKSLAGVLIQIPVFIAAFDMLGENFRLAGQGFLWIEDLALPDQAAGLPFALPFFGAYLNLLPLVMTALTVLAARLQEDASLAPELRAGQRLRLYAMAIAFLLLLYTFPAAMVLYWTANNFWHLLRVLWDRGRARGAQP